jgi:hypothetical protein
MLTFVVAESSALINVERILAGALGLLIGLVGLWAGLKQLKNRKALNRWPTTNGRVVERGVFEPSSILTSAPAYRFSPLVKYIYEVNRQEFNNDRINPQRIQQPTHNTRKWAEKRAASFPEVVVVHYNPEDPGESFLVQTSHAMLYVVVAASCVALLFSAVLLLVK